MDTSFDSQFEQTGFIKFYPFVGDKYNVSIPRILILGESHYISSELSPSKEEIETWNEDNNTTRDAVEEGYKPYKNTVSLLTNAVIDNEWIYENIAFYNFFQKYVGIGSSDKSLIDLDLIELSQKAYFSIIDIMEPDFIIAWGTSTLYNYWVPQDECDILSEDSMLYRYKKFPNTNIWHIKHPSSRSFDLFESTNSFSKICGNLGYTFPIKFKINKNM
jgi:hypothetical protein